MNKAPERSRVACPRHSLFVIRYLSVLLSLLLSGFVLAQTPPSQSPETIKIGPLKPLETLPSLGSTPAIQVPPVMTQKAESPSTAPNQPAASPSATPPPLPTNSSLVLTGPVAQAYLYVEPYQSRVEVLFDAARIIEWLLPEHPATESLSPELQRELCEKAASRAHDWCELTAAEIVLATPQPLVAVIKGVPGNTLPLKEDESVALNQAMVGFIWEFATPPGPDELSITWRGWPPSVAVLPVRAFFGPLNEVGEIHPAVKKFRWRNLGRLPRPAPLAAVPQFEALEAIPIPVGAIVWLLVGLVFYTYLKVKDHKLPGGSLPYTAVWLLGAALMWRLFVVPYQPGSSTPKISQVEEAQKIVTPLLRNVYRAFDHHAESDVYDVLARSVEGELLRRLYLETIQALTLDGREGTRVTIAEFSATVDKVEPNPKGEGFVADCNWMARGIVGHWGHSHPRVNIYNARITITPGKGEWKLTSLEVQEVRRL